LFLLVTLCIFLSAEPSSHAENMIIPGGDDFLEGRRLQSAGEWAGSIERFQAAAGVYSLVADYALYQMSQSALQLGDTDLSASALEKLLSLHPDTPVGPFARLEMIDLYFNSGEHARAIPHLQTALRGAKSSRESASLTLMLAKAHAASDDVSKANSICWRIIHGWPSRPEALEAVELVGDVDSPEKTLAVAKVYSLNREARRALDLLEELMIDPTVGPLMPDILFHMARSLAQEKKKQAAADLYGEIATEYPKSSAAAGALFERGKYHRSMGMTDEALDDFQQVVDRFPRNAMAALALKERAKIFEKREDPLEYEQYERLLSDFPRYGLTLTSIMHWGVKLYVAGDYTGARSVFERLAAADLGTDANADAAFWIAKCTIAKGNTSLAKIQLAGVIKRLGESHQAFRARSILNTLAEAQALYSNRNTTDWSVLFVYDRKPFESLENENAQEAYPPLERELSSIGRESLDRIGFFMLSDLPEAKWELARTAGKISGPNARYALAWALFHSRGYNDSIMVASSLRGRLKEPPRAVRLQYLLYPAAYPGLVGAAAARYDIDPMLSLAVMREESHFREETVSVADARGLMQIIPPTGEWLATKVFGPARFDITLLFRPGVNIELGAYYLRYLLDKFDGNAVLAIAAYNWGEGNLRKWLKNSPPGDLDVFIESIPADETRRYVKKVIRSYAVYHSLYPTNYLEKNRD